MKLSKVCLLILFLFISCAEDQKKPNFVFIYTDDQRFDTVGAMGNDEIYTPNLDKLANNGVLFTNAYNMGAWHGAICVASRAMMISGKSVWRAKDQISELKKGDSIALSKTWPRILNKNGYKTYMTGKWHVDAPVDKIFDVVKNERPGMPGDTRGELGARLKEWRINSGEYSELENFMPIGYGRPKDKNDNSWIPYDSLFGGFWEGGKHWSEVLADDSIDFIDQAKDDSSPFFMYLSFNAPHDPRQAPKEFLDLYPIEDIKVPKNYLPQHPYLEEIGNKPGLRDEALAPYPRTKFAVKKHIQEYYAVISHLDEQVGKIIDHLEKENLLENTYVFFTSDHGLAVGQHGLIGKQSLYDHSIRVPMIISGPKLNKGEKYNQDIYLQDIVPTTLELAKIEIPDEIDFKSFYPIINKQSEKSSHNGIYGTFGCCPPNYKDFQRMIRKDGFKLMAFPVNKRIELYDLKSDPFEKNNLSEKLKFKNKINDMLSDLILIQEEVGDTLNLKQIFNVN
tara:strand:- start:1208 stop:2731 length:1524 start_codon:yes stop_codon:yes gene_type:complete